MSSTQLKPKRSHAVPSKAVHYTQIDNVRRQPRERGSRKHELMLFGDDCLTWRVEGRQKRERQQRAARGQPHVRWKRNKDLGNLTHGTSRCCSFKYTDAFFVNFHSTALTATSCCALPARGGGRGPRPLPVQT